MRLAALVLGIAVALVAPVAGAADLSVAEVGSLHVGGRAVSLSGLPTRDVVFTAGSAPIKVDPNGDFEAEQMYVQYVKLVQPEGALPAAALARRRSHRRHLGDEAGRPAGLAALLPARRSRRLRLRRRRARPRLVGPLSGDPARASRCSAPRSRRGRTSASVPSAATSSTRPTRVALPGQLFPVEAFDQFMKQGVPRWSTTDAQIQAAYNQLVQKVCPCVISDPQPGR